MYTFCSKFSFFSFESMEWWWWWQLDLSKVTISLCFKN